MASFSPEVRGFRVIHGGLTLLGSNEPAITTDENNISLIQLFESFLKVCKDNTGREEYHLILVGEDTEDVKDIGLHIEYRATDGSFHISHYRKVLKY